MKNPPKLVYERILSIGSSELISGLFLELAKNKDDVILKEAKLLIESDIDWTGRKNADSLRRCANIYLNALSPELRKRKEDKIRKSLVNMDLRLKKLNGKLIPDDKILEGATYRKYSMNGYLSDVYEYYDYEKDDM